MKIRTNDATGVDTMHDMHFRQEPALGGLSRREVMRGGFLTAAAWMARGFSLPVWAAAAAVPAIAPGKAKSVIQIWMWGGPAHLDTFDPKPGAGHDYSGPLDHPIATNVSGIQIGELMPLLAKQADKYSLIRSMTHGLNARETASYTMQTGRLSGGHDVFPNVGAVVSLFKGHRGGYKGLIPPYIVLTEPQGRFKGREVAHADHYSFHPDPALMYEIPADGAYKLAIHDSIYRGREDFVYRVALGELPFVTGMFPLGGKAGGKTTVEFTGWNLTQTRLTARAGKKDRGVELLSPGEVEFDARSFALDTLPETAAKEQNYTRGMSQKISLPVLVNGRVARKSEFEFFQFKGNAGEEIEAEVYARRLDSPLDSMLTLMDANGKPLASNDDFVDESAGLVTDQADSRISYELPADGAYYLKLADTEGNGGPEFAYRLRVSHPQPDFELRIAPSSISAKAGEIVPLTVYALRRGGFAGDVALKLKDAPHGYELSGAVIPGSQTHVRMIMRVPFGEGNQTSHVSLEGLATVDGKQVRRTSVPADDRMQAFFYHHLVTTRDLLVTVHGKQRLTTEWTARVDHPLALFAGRAIAVKFDMPNSLSQHVKIALNDLPEGITLDRATPLPDGMVVYLNTDGIKAKAGLRGNLILTATTDPPSTPNTAQTKVLGKPQAKSKAPSLTEFMPAFPFEVFVGTTHPAPATVLPAQGR